MIRNNSSNSKSTIKTRFVSSTTMLMIIFNKKPPSTHRKIGSNYTCIDKKTCSSSRIMGKFPSEVELSILHLTPMI